MNKHQKASLITRQKLITAALKIFKEKGFGTIAVEDITKAAGVAKGSFYSHFKRKEDIIVEICREPFRCVCEETENSTENIVAKLTKYFQRFMECIEIYDINVCREWIKDVINPKFAPEDRDNQKWEYDVESLRNILSVAVKNKELDENTPVELLTHIFICELYGMMICWCMSDGKFEPLEWTAKFCAVQISNILQPYLLLKDNIL